MQAQESQIGQWKNSYLHNIIQFCVDWRTVFFKVELIFNNASLDRLERHTEKSSNLICSRVKLFLRCCSRSSLGISMPGRPQHSVNLRLLSAFAGVLRENIRMRIVSVNSCILYIGRKPNNCRLR